MPTVANPDQRGDPYPGRQKDDIAARVGIGFTADILLRLPFAIELEHRVDHKTLGAQRMLMMMAVTMVRMVHRGLVRSLCVAAQEPIGHRAIIMEAVAEIGVLRTFRCNRCKGRCGRPTNCPGLATEQVRAWGPRSPSRVGTPLQTTRPDRHARRSLRSAS